MVFKFSCIRRDFLMADTGVETTMDPILGYCSDLSSIRIVAP
ncbi:hypothetical protein CU004_2855 [Enterococcus faecium]|nr:hypothetical protein [Enterococcus faecium]